MASPDGLVKRRVMTRAEASQIREHLGHNGAECRVRIHRDGRVERYGSPDPTDRSRDFWAFVGLFDEIFGEIVSESTRKGKYHAM